MLIPRIVLTSVIFAFGSSLALAGGSGIILNGPLGEHSVSAPTASDEATQSNGEKLEVLESKLHDLEDRIDKNFINSTDSPQNLNLKENPYSTDMIQTMQGWSSNEHLLKAKTIHQKSSALEGKIQKLQERIDRFSKKPYLDTKGFKRASLRILKGNLTKELGEATAKAAWHKEQAKRVMISESRHQKRS